MQYQFSTTFSIGGTAVGGDAPCYIIAEAGVSHFGSLEKAFKLVDLAKQAEADCVKFQIYDVDALISNESMEWKERLGPRALAYEQFAKIKEYCIQQNITFMATAHDEVSLEYLETLDVPAYKIGSGEVGNWNFLEKTAALQKPVILSTGMYNMGQVGEGIDAMAKTGNLDLAILHCVTRYPTPPAQVNLSAMDSIKKEFGIITGYSDHTEDFHIPLAAVARGAKIIEKHISLDFDIPNAQDWKVSCGPHNLATFVRQVRDIESAIGSGVKVPSEQEKESLAWASKSVVAAKGISAGDVLSAGSLVCKRPGGGIPPWELPRLIGKTVNRTIKMDELIQREFICE